MIQVFLAYCYQRSTRKSKVAPSNKPFQWKDLQLKTYLAINYIIWEEQSRSFPIAPSNFRGYLVFSFESLDSVPCPFKTSTLEGPQSFSSFQKTRTGSAELTNSPFLLLKRKESNYTDWLDCSFIIENVDPELSLEGYQMTTLPCIRF